MALDTGGTFTDFVAVSPDQTQRRLKLPSDGSLAVRVGGVRPTGEIEIESIAGLVPADGLLDGAQVRVDGETVARVASQAGTRLTLKREAADWAPHAGDALRLSWEGEARALRDAPQLGLRLLTSTPWGAPLPQLELRLSTTRGTNALLERRTDPVGLIASDGLDGLLAIHDQTRDELFARVPAPREPLTRLVAAIPERDFARVSADSPHRARRGAPRPLRTTRAALVAAAERLRAQGAARIVVSLAHALECARERELAEELCAAGFVALAASEVSRAPRLLARTETAIVHASIAPILERFVSRAADGVVHGSVGVFTSAATLHDAARFLARDTLLSGPAGGAAAVAAIARRHGIPRAVGLDMGGTSSDVVRVVDGAVGLRAEARVGRATVAAPSVAIETVAAGGGSIARIRSGIGAGERIVGPESAGANPGPACMGRGGPLTLTDVNLLLGRVPDRVSGVALDRDAALRAITAVRGAEAADSADETLLAFLEIANTRMALAIERLVVRDAADPSDHALIAFGGAGGQHACGIAERLGIARIVFPKDAGYLCARGVLDAPAAHDAVVPVLAVLTDEAHETLRAIDAAEREARTALDQHARGAAAIVTARVSLRLLGQESTIEVDAASAGDMRAAFARRFAELFGAPPPRRALEVESVRVRAEIPTHGSSQDSAVTAPALGGGGAVRTTRRMASHGRFVEARVVDRASLRAGERIEGPAIIADTGDTAVLDAGWRATVDDHGDLVAQRVGAAPARASVAEQELFAARLEAIALSMGEVLERTALSPNIRERLDFSCAVLDSSGTLIQNAPHLPVHLGALGACVRGVLGAITLGEGDIAFTNHPAFGGSHLPDVTAIAPVHVDGVRVAFVAVRAHHAEIGGTRPGSFPPDARSLAEEGVVLAPFLAVRRGVLDATACRERFADALHPSRNPDENLADLAAQVAAARHGVVAVARLVRELGAADFAARSAGELDRAERALRSAVRGMRVARRHAERELDDGSLIRVAVAREGDRLRVDFTGSAPTHPRNFNAPLAVTTAATLYALRLLVDEPVPMNEGLLRAVDLVVPSGMLNPAFDADPTRCPPVVAGNVETSQSVVAVLVDALELAAESQSTMNNILFGDATFGVYETLGGGAGAGPRRDGASAVHTHMSNTRLTDIEVLERRAPVVVRTLEVRRGSGGAGASRGGDGLMRGYEFLAPVSLSHFASRRRHAPRGVLGGGDGLVGCAKALLSGELREFDAGVLSLELDAGDTFTVFTPGGGGYGAP